MAQLKLKLCAPVNRWETEAQGAVKACLSDLPLFLFPVVLTEKRPISSRFRQSLGRAWVSLPSSSHTMGLSTWGLAQLSTETCLVP